MKRHERCSLSNVRDRRTRLQVPSHRAGRDAALLRLLKVRRSRHGDRQDDRDDLYQRWPNTVAERSPNVDTHDVIHAPSSRLWSIDPWWYALHLLELPTHRELCEWSKLPPLRPSYGLTTNGIATIPVTGILTRRQSAWQRHQNGTPVDLVCDSIRKAVANPRVKGVMLTIGDSAGGECGCVNDLQLAIESSSKPVIGFLHGDNHGEAFGLAVACDELYAHPMARVGSFEHVEAFDPLLLIEDAAPLPVGFETFLAETSKRFGRAAIEAEEERCATEQRTDDYESVILARVDRRKFIESRRALGMSFAQLNDIDTIWTAKEPIGADELLARGLVDELAEFDDASFGAAWSSSR